MPENSASSTRRCETRYAIEDCESTHVTIVVSTDQGEERHDGFLADLSTNGVRVALGLRLKQGLAVQFYLSVPMIQLNLHTDAVVRWLQPRDGESWWIGCELLEPIPMDVVDALATAGLVNRRRDPRYEVAHPATAKWELADEQIDVELVDYSKGGFCMLCQEARNFRSERVMLLLPVDEQTVKIPARVMWQRQLDHGYAVGCSFRTMDGFVMFRDAVEPGRTPLDGRLVRSPRPMSFSRWVVITAIVLLAVNGLELAGDQASPKRRANKSFIESFVQTVQATLLGKSSDLDEPADQD